MANSPDPWSHDRADAPVTDWSGVLRLAIVAGVVAGLVAIALHDVVTERTLVVGIIVAATMASWFQIEHPRPATRRLPARRK